MNPNELEVAPGFAKENLQGLVWDSASEEALRAGLEKAFDYRGDVTITKTDGSKVEGYVFDRRPGKSLKDSFVRVIPASKGGGPLEKIPVAYSEIAGLAFTGRDNAAGKSWEAWVKKYVEKKAAGEKNIELVPENLD
jgi:hypothetical protein